MKAKILHGYKSPISPTNYICGMAAWKGPTKLIDGNPISPVGPLDTIQCSKGQTIVCIRHDETRVADDYAVFNTTDFEKIGKWLLRTGKVSDEDFLSPNDESGLLDKLRKGIPITY